MFFKKKILPVVVIECVNETSNSLLSLSSISDRLGLIELLWQVIRRYFIKWCLTSIQLRRGCVIGRTGSSGSEGPTFLVSDFHST